MSIDSVSLKQKYTSLQLTGLMVKELGSDINDRIIWLQFNIMSKQKLVTTLKEKQHASWLTSGEVCHRGLKSPSI